MGCVYSRLWFMAARADITAEHAHGDAPPPPPPPSPEARTATMAFDGGDAGEEAACTLHFTASAPGGATATVLVGTAHGAGLPPRVACKFVDRAPNILRREITFVTGAFGALTEKRCSMEDARLCLPVALARVVVKEPSSLQARADAAERARLDVRACLRLYDNGATGDDAHVRAFKPEELRECVDACDGINSVAALIMPLYDDDLWGFVLERDGASASVATGPGSAAARRRALASRAALRLAADIGRALAFLHGACGIVHTDVTAANVFVRTDPASGAPLAFALGDVGCATWAHGARRAPTASANAAADNARWAWLSMQTWHVMAPEVCLGAVPQGRAEPAADAWGLGCVLAFAVLGAPPWLWWGEHGGACRALGTRFSERQLAANAATLWPADGRTLTKRAACRRAAMLARGLLVMRHEYALGRSTPLSLRRAAGAANGYAYTELVGCAQGVLRTLRAPDDAYGVPRPPLASVCALRDELQCRVYRAADVKGIARERADHTLATLVLGLLAMDPALRTSAGEASVHAEACMDDIEHR